MHLVKIRRAFVWLLAVAVGTGVPACNTMKGAGRDVERAGEEIQEEAHDIGKPSSRDID
jgi:predicted small secreted protein